MMNALSICQGSGTLFLTNIRKGNQIKNWREKACVNVERLLYKLQGRKSHIFQQFTVTTKATPYPAAFEITDPDLQI